MPDARPRPDGDVGLEVRGRVDARGGIDHGSGWRLLWAVVGRGGSISRASPGSQTAVAGSGPEVASRGRPRPTDQRGAGGPATTPTPKAAPSARAPRQSSRVRTSPWTLRARRTGHPSSVRRGPRWRRPSARSPGRIATSRARIEYAAPRAGQADLLAERRPDPPSSTETRSPRASTTPPGDRRCRWPGPTDPTLADVDVRRLDVVRAALADVDDVGARSARLGGGGNLGGAAALVGSDTRRSTGRGAGFARLAVRSRSRGCALVGGALIGCALVGDLAARGGSGPDDLRAGRSTFAASAAASRAAASSAAARSGEVAASLEGSGWSAGRSGSGMRLPSLVSRRVCSAYPVGGCSAPAGLGDVGWRPVGILRRSERAGDRHRPTTRCVTPRVPDACQPLRGSIVDPQHSERG